MNTDSENRMIVSCDACGSPHPAILQSDGGWSVVNEDGDMCSNCGGTSFSSLPI